MPKRSKSIIAAIAGMILIATGFALSPAYAVPDYPTAAEVAAAKRNVEEKKKMISRIEGILNTLQDEADALESVALQKNEQYNQAKQAVKIMAEKVEGLEAKVKTAEEEAGEAKTMLGQIVARMYRQGTSGNTTQPRRTEREGLLRSHPPPGHRACARYQVGGGGVSRHTCGRYPCRNRLRAHDTASPLPWWSPTRY
jgi:septal ring factor EnvC (AmiA/AmiB activator)